MHRLSLLVAAAAAIALGSAAVRWGTYAAGGSDSSCYALMADAFGGGRLQPTSDLAASVPWPEAGRTFVPGGFAASPASLEPVPVCAPGFSLLLAPFAAAGGPDAIFLLMPIAAAALVWVTYLAGSGIGGSLAGAMAAILVAVSPAVLYQAVQPMNDVTTAALWIATFAALVRRKWGMAGIACGLALLVRPNLLPMVVPAGVFTLVAHDDGAGDSRGERLLRFVAPVVPFGLIVLALNNALYGSPLRTGYGQVDQLFGVASAGINAPRYVRWLVETHTSFPLFGLAAPFVIAAGKRRDVALAIALILANFALYTFYTPFDEWTYLRFLLPAIALLQVLAAAATVALLARTRRLPQAAIAGAITVALAAFCLRAAEDRLAFELRALERRYRSAGAVVREHLPDRAVALSVWDSGAVRFHGRKEAISWEALDPLWLDRALAWLEAQGRPPFILLESWEEPAFRKRFEASSDIGRLDWPPKYEIDRVVRIYDPRDRVRHLAGEFVQTEYLWPR